MDSTKLLLIDGDILVYRIGFAVEAREGDLDLAHLLCSKTINDMMTNTASSDYEIYLTSTDKSNFRYELAKRNEYKGSKFRLKQKKPIFYNQIRDFLQDRYLADVCTGIEADDMLGIRQCNVEVPSCIASVDKDLDMIPGEHYNIRTGESYLTSDEDNLELRNSRKKLFGGGIKWFYAQMLLGDLIDNIEGIKGYGCVKTYNTLNEIKDEKKLLREVLGIYKDVYGKQGKEYFLENMDLLWIQRKPRERKSELIQELI